MAYFLRFLRGGVTHGVGMQYHILFNIIRNKRQFHKKKLPRYRAAAWWSPQNVCSTLQWKEAKAGSCKHHDTTTYLQRGLLSCCCRQVHAYPKLDMYTSSYISYQGGISYQPVGSSFTKQKKSPETKVENHTRYQV